MTATNSSDQGIMDKKPVVASSADSNNNNKLVVISCTKNCEKTIDDSISCARKNRSFQQGNGVTILNYAFSTDDTRQAAVKAGASLVMQQPSNKFPGKGIAMKTGLEAAIKAKVDAIVFLDGAIKNLAPE